MIFFPNAKVNLGLNIVRRRPDGYHDIETLFYPVKGLCDILEVVATNGEGNSIEFTQTGIGIDCDTENNLCVKAYRLLAQRCGMPHVKMHLHKLIPMGAGLGGGSADAAFALKALNSFLKDPLSNDNLMALASELGSDCPFFITNTPSIGRGRGELLEPANIDLTGYWILLVNPGIHISTKETYESSNPKPWDNPIGKIVNLPVSDWPNRLVNDFEKSVFPKYPLIERVKDELYSMGAVYASMSGSGSTVFGIFKRKPEIPDGFKGYFTHTSEI
ncbi:MAG TPA: 4-(cytidine 5'-diphospho)-2-C-methyl-D-erythritol kinase [Bacteroidales bacterium]|nr:4-(cytidine 5'-diphospho)-2-C-methyl-D-erythritol kinase [Bacteroidales bacterium]